MALAGNAGADPVLNSLCAQVQTGANFYTHTCARGGTQAYPYASTGGRAHAQTYTYADIDTCSYADFYADTDAHSYANTHTREGRYPQPQLIHATRKLERGVHRQGLQR